MFRSKIPILLVFTISFLVSSYAQKQRVSQGEATEAKLNGCYSYAVNHGQQVSSPCQNLNSMSKPQNVSSGSDIGLFQKSTRSPYDEDDEEYYKNKPPVVVNQPNQKVALAEKVSKGIFDLSHKLVAKVLEQSQNKFEVISPVSISAALQLAFLGANKETYRELRAVLGYEGKIIFLKYYFIYFL